MSIFQKIKDFFYPPHYTCIFCNCEIDEELDICPDCAKHLPYLDGHLCLRCGQKLHDESDYCDQCKSNPDPWYFDACRSVFVYTYPVTRAIRMMKYDNAKYLFDTLSKLVTKLFEDNEWSADIIVPVPLHPKRTKSRGYNQAELLAKDLSTTYNIPMDTEHLVRVEDTPSQTMYNTKNRKENVANAFDLTIRNIYRNKIVLLIDDVITSGATIDACAKLLKEKGKAKQVLAITLAHSPVRDTSQKIK